MVIYLVIVMFMAIAESEGYHGASFTNIQFQELEDLSYQYKNITDTSEPLRASIGFLNVFLGIVVKSLLFQYEIQEAPDVVNC